MMNALKPTPAIEKRFNRFEQIAIDYMESEETLKKELKEKKAMIKSLLEGDADYKELKDRITEMKRQLKVKEDLLKHTDSAKKTLHDIEDLQNTLKENQLTLSDYLAQYVEDTKATTIEDKKGNVKVIVKSFKVANQRP